LNSAFGGRLIVLAACVIAVVPFSQTPESQPRPAIVDDPALSDEFVGPFPSWKVVTTAYGAAGDGKTDDTEAIQRGLTALESDEHTRVLFVPAGTYRITQTLTLGHRLGVAIIGEDPKTTTIVWDGEPGGTMLSINGLAYSRIGRLTFDGKTRASIAVDQSWDSVKPHFDTGNEYADDRFINVEYGIRGGFKGHGFAETSIIRSQFVRNTVAAIAHGNFNALDTWVWESRFEDCATGVTNGGGAGNFHVYSSVFLRSTVSDLAMGNTGGFSARGNYSRGSQAFFVSVVAKSYPATIHLQRNTILDPLGTTPIDLRNQGPGVVSDNVILSRGSGPALRWNGLNGADVTSIGNTFTLAKPIENSGRLLSIGDRSVEPQSVNPAVPVLPGTPRNLRRPVFEITPGTRVADIQRTLDKAFLESGKRPVVHLATGAYSIDATLTIPASDVQVVGDGYGTILQWSGPGEGPVFRLQGPSHVTIRDLQIDGVKRANGIVVDNVDQIGARVYLDQVQLRSGKQTDLFVNGIDHATIELRDFGHAYSPSATSVKVSGGPLLRAGKAAEGKTNIFSGAASGHTISYDISNGARVLIRDLWYESGAGPGFAHVHGNAVLTIDGARISTKAQETPAAIHINDLSGRVAIIATHLDDRIAVTGAGQAAQVLGLGIYDQQRSTGYLVNRSSPAAQVALVNSRHSTVRNWSVPSPDVGQVDHAFIERLFSHTRSEMPRPITPLPTAVSDVRLWRVWVANGLNNMIIGQY
jgi:hypothetical protein